MNHSIVCLCSSREIHIFLSSWWDMMAIRAFCGCWDVAFIFHKAVHVIILSNELLLSFCQLHVEIKRQTQHAVRQLSCSIYLPHNESVNCCFVCVKRRSCIFVILMGYGWYQITDEWWQAMYKLFENVYTKSYVWLFLIANPSCHACSYCMYREANQNDHVQVLLQIYKSNQFIISVNSSILSTYHNIA